MDHPSTRILMVRHLEVTRGDDGPPTVTLVCSSCGTAFEHEAHKPGRSPGKCPQCRSGGAHEAQGEAMRCPPAAAEAERVIAGRPRHALRAASRLPAGRGHGRDRR